MRRQNPVSVKVKAPSRGLISRWPGETADAFSTGSDRFNTLGIQNRASTVGSNVRYEDGVVKNAPGYDRVNVVASITVDLLAHWRLDELSGTRNDATLNHHDLLEILGTGETEGVDQIEGKFKDAALFVEVPAPLTADLIAIPDNIVSGGISSCQNILVTGGIAYTTNGINFYSSADGLNWTLVGVNGSTGLSITFAASLFVMGGNSGFLKTSPDGVTWTARTSNVSGAIFSIVYTGSRFIGIDDNGDVTYSDDAITWTQVSAGLNNINQVVFGAGIVVGVGDSGEVQTSSDGVTWTPQTSGTIDSLRDVTYDGSKFIAVGGTSTILTSIDGVTWTPVTPIGLGSGSNRFIAWSGSRYGLFKSNKTFFVSGNLISWTQVTVSLGAWNFQNLSALDTDTFILAEQDAGS